MQAPVMSLGSARRVDWPRGATVTQGDGSAPLLDPAVLERLREELEGDEGVWRVFVQNFIGYLPERIERLRQTLTTGDFRGAMDAVLSLKTSSQMVGAERLAEMAIDLERALRNETRDTDPSVALPHLAAEHLRRIKQCGRQTTYLLQATLRQKPDLG